MAYQILSSGLVCAGVASSSTAVADIPVGVGSGNGRILLVSCAGIRGATQTFSGVTFNSVAGSILRQGGADGGIACTMAVAIFDDSDLPASSGTYGVEFDLGAGSFLDRHISWVLLGSANQTTPTLGDNIATDINLDETGGAAGPSVAVAEAGQTGKGCFLFLATGDTDEVTAAPVSTAPGGATLLQQSDEFDTITPTPGFIQATMALAHLPSLASDSESFAFTVDTNSPDDSVDSVVTMAVIINDTFDAGGGNIHKLIGGASPLIGPGGGLVG